MKIQKSNQKQHIKLAYIHARLLQKKNVFQVLRKVKNKILKCLKSQLEYGLLLLNPCLIDQRLFDSFRTSMAFFFSDEDEPYYTNHYTDKKKDAILKQANKICSHIFDLLGSGEVNLGEKINWSCDFKSGYVWSRKYYKNIKLVDLTNSADVKVPWELSRFQHVFTLGKAYWLNKDKKYALEFKAQLLDWIEENPYKLSVNWACTMDVAIRAANWITGFYLFRNCTLLDKEFWCKLNSSLYQHGMFIIDNLENKDRHTSNHYIANLVGLIWLGLYFRGFKLEQATFNSSDNEPQRWLNLAMSELQKEMLVQVNKDGTSYEASTAYHRLVAELLLLTAKLCSNNDIFFEQEFYERLEKMCEFIKDVTKPNGLAPIVGDADDGRLLIVSEYPNWKRNDFRHLLAVAGEYFDRDDFRMIGKDYFEDALWICRGQKLPSLKQVSIKSASYRDGGFYILKNPRIYLLIRCGKLSFNGQGGHSHNDQLSFELNVDGEDIVVDPGLFVYSADYKMRNLFRSTKVHNTLSVPGIEQNEFNEFVLFEMREQSFGECLEASDSHFSGRHYGYKGKYGLCHKRTVMISNSGISILDQLEGESNNIIAKCCFTFSEKIKSLSKTTLLGRNTVIEIKTQEPTKHELKEANIAYGYGKLVKSKKLEIEVGTSSLIEFKFIQKQDYIKNLNSGRRKLLV